MSWSVNLFGAAEKVVAALETENSGLSGQSKAEWDEVKPHLLALVKGNFVSDEYKDQYPGVGQPAVKLEASGSQSTSGGKPLQGSCSVKIEVIYTKLV